MLEKSSFYPDKEPVTVARPQLASSTDEDFDLPLSRSQRLTTSQWHNREEHTLEPMNDVASREHWSGRAEVHSTPLNPRYTFESFVVGNHNRLAHAAALSVADHPGQRFNPLFIYGGVGLGKTHLLHAIGNQVARHGMQVLYCSSEQFTNDLISAIRGQSTEEFRNKYRQIDLLLIDDIQFIGGKESTQEEFFHTFNHLHAAGRQVVISSDRPPKEIATLEARLRSRFEGGLQADISQPDLETRVAILQTKAAMMKTSIPMDVLMLVAERVESNIRELEGALNRLIVQAPLYENGLTRKAAEEILNNLMPQRRPREASSVLQIVAEHFRLTVEDLKGRTRTKEIAHARQVAMYMLREENSLSLPIIGTLLGGRDHSTVRYGVEKVGTDMDEDEELRRHILTLREKVYAPPASR
jgi:chromosomal replication initiator protein